MIGKTLSHYRITHLLGRGGMGVVYKAEDLRLERPVALKFLTPELLKNESEKQRFVQEARAAAALEHANICTVHEIEESEGQLFIALAYVSGENLKDRIARTGPLPLAETLDLALQMAEGLAEAHRRGIVHRDIKSSNIMVTESGQAKIMDFGLARIDGKATVTAEGKSLGTPAYMSPEQIRRESVDQRSDIWSFGVVLYEMLTGELPFQGANEHEIMYAIQVDELPAGRPVPTALEAVVRKCLQKNPDRRYQEMAEVIADLKKAKRSLNAERAGTRARLLRGAVVVLAGLLVAGLAYFVLLSDSRQDRARSPAWKSAPLRDSGAYEHYFRGEQLLNRLKFLEAQQAYQQALARDSSFALAYYRLAYVRSWQLGDEARARAPLQKALALLDRLPEKERLLVRADHARLTKGWNAYFAALRELERRYPEDPEVRFRVGDFYVHTGQARKAVRYLEQVVAQDPTHGRALQHLVEITFDLQQYGKALEYARRFLSVTDSERAYFLLAQVYEKLHDLEGGVKTLLQARVAYPDHPNLTVALAALYTSQQRYAQAEQELLRLAQDPRPEARFWGNWGLAFFYPYLGKYRAARRACEAVIRWHWQTHDTTGAAIMQLYKALLTVWSGGAPVRAWQEAEETQPYRHRLASHAYWMGLAYLALFNHDYERAEGILRERREQLAWFYPVLHAFKGECELAESTMRESRSETPEPYQIVRLFHLAQCRFEQGAFEAAAEALLQLQAIQDHGGGFRAAYYPKSLYWLGRIYDALGERKRARKYYQALLALWHDAEPNLPERLDAEARLAILPGDGITRR